MTPRPRAPLGWRSPLALLAVVLPLAALPGASHADATWQQLGTGITRGISGLAPAPSGWVIARDNKSAGQNRIALLSPGRQVTQLNWPGTDPKDLESLAKVPGTSNRYITCTSARKCKVFDLSGATITVRRSLTLPVGGSENEALALTRMSNGSTVALWADRGSGSTPGKLHAAVLNLSTWKFGTATTASVSVPWPSGPVRHVSDAAVVEGHILVTSASDPGNNGPFDSAAYDVGTLSLSSSRVTFSLHTPTELGRFSGHKIEGLACAASGPDLLGSDDENRGGAVAVADVC
jgi:hypothetical protein